MPTAAFAYVRTVAHGIIQVCPKSFASNQPWLQSHRSDVAASITDGLSRKGLTGADWLFAYQKFSKYLPRDWREVCRFDWARLRGSPPVEVPDTGSPMDDIKQSVVDMVIAIAWAHKVHRRQVRTDFVSGLRDLAGEASLSNLLSHLDAAVLSPDSSVTA